MNRNPITQLGRVVTHAQIDIESARHRKRGESTTIRAVPHCTTQTCDDDFSVQPHEVCLMMRDTAKLVKRQLTRTPADADMRLLTSVNGLKTHVDNITEGDVEATKRAVRRTLRFGGIADTRSQYKIAQRQPNEALFVTQMGGMCTCVNTGSATIYAGQHVMWDLPSHKGECISRNGSKTKQLVAVRPFRLSCDEAVTQAHVRKMGERLRNDQTFAALVKKAGSSNGVALAALRKKLLDDDYDEQRSRIFGKALTRAQPGERFDVILGRYAS